jgi:hypothetical protein
VINTISCHFQAHRNEIAVEECLRRFRVHFPNIPIYLHGDNGYDFSQFETKFNLKYTHWNDNAPPRGFSDGTKWKTYLERVLLTCKTFPNEWLLFLEEDVNTLGNNIHPPNSDFAGVIGHSLSFKLSNYIKEIHPHHKIIRYNMCGGSIVKVDAMIKSIESVFSGKIDIDMIATMDNRIIRYSDILISTILLLNGYTYSEWSCLSETNSGIYKENVVFDHSWKEFYNKSDWEYFIAEK